MRFRICAVAITIATIAATASADIALYRGQNAESKAIAISGLGTGAVEFSTDRVRVGSAALKITSKGRYQGALVTFVTPVDVATVAESAPDLLTFALLTAETSSGTSNIKPLKFLRVTITTDDDKRTELNIPFVGPRGEEGWTTVGVPLSAFPNFASSSKKIKQIGIATDIPATVYVGEISLMNDTTPISVDAYVNDGNKEVYIANNDVALFWVQAEAGASVLKYEWDFDDTDGFQAEMEGRVVEYMFRKPGTYKVSVRVSDQFGVKKEVKADLTVKVAP